MAGPQQVSSRGLQARFPSSGISVTRTSVVTPENVTIEWEGELLPETIVTINGDLSVPLGSLISHTHGEALDWLTEYLPK